MASTASGHRRSSAQLREILLAAAKLVIDEGKTREAARERYRVGSTALGLAIAQLRAERAAGGRP